MAVFGVDYAWGRPGTTALRNAGARFACRYLSHDTTGKNLTRDEAEELSDAGLWLVVVWETAAARALAGRGAGVADARDAAEQAAACGMPDDRPIYFAVDFDAAPSQQPAINAYLDGAASVIGRDRIGLYAGYGPMDRAFDAGMITYGWQTYAWSGGRWDPRIHLQQYSNDRTLNGVIVDYDRAVRTDYGQWRVGVSPRGDDMPDYVSAGVIGQELQPGVWTTVDWGIEYSDAEGQHRDEGGPSLLTGPAKYTLSATLTLVGVPAGTRVQARSIEVDAADTSRHETGAVHDHLSAGDPTNLLFGMAADSVGRDRRVRLQVRQHGPAAATITGGTAKVLFWK
ncbi:glycoside hydrolase domain-containing protein [Spirillospora albida]|uniref:glycoside hydrolase domain-containing protein n=1 Tax=Spirillospora albida TaxID=58123 RepID=UPI00068B050C|nr:glycoside hydrolase domain-containing protein [Spirillospora albida]